MIISTKKSSPRTGYPKLMISQSDLIVLFTSKYHGTVVSPGTSTKNIGYSSDQWAYHNFVDYTGEITLKNK
jgi:hypothetical protein